MSELKLKYDEARKNETAKQDQEKTSEQSKEIEFYDTPGNTRNLCLVLSDGKQVFLNYAYLISGEFSTEDSTITLTFTTHMVTLKGQTLEALYEALITHSPKQIKSIEKRYLATRDQQESMVSEIKIVKN